MKFDLLFNDNRECLMINQDASTIYNYINEYQKDHNIYPLLRSWFHWDKEELVIDFGMSKYFYISWRNKGYTKKDIINDLWPEYEY